MVRPGSQPCSPRPPPAARLLTPPGRHPAPSPALQDGPTFRPEANARGGKKQFPYLVDPSPGVEMYESDAIISYLFEKYGDGKVRA